MAADPKQSEALRQIQEAFQSAQSQMAQLRQQVEKHAELARAKTQNDFIQKEKERARHFELAASMQARGYS